jgi:hypothetical protein
LEQITQTSEGLIYIYICIYNFRFYRPGIFTKVDWVFFSFSQNPAIKNTTRGLDFGHMMEVRAHKGGVRIGKTPKKLASICCP